MLETSESGEVQLDMFAAEEGRDAGIALTVSTEERAAWVAEARRVAFQLCVIAGRVTSDDLVAVFPVPRGWDARIVGSVFNPRVAGFPFVLWHFDRSKRKQGHRRPMSVWRLRPEISETVKRDEETEAFSDDPAVRAWLKPLTDG